MGTKFQKVHDKTFSHAIYTLARSDQLPFQLISSEPLPRPLPSHPTPKLLSLHHPSSCLFSTCPTWTFLLLPPTYPLISIFCSTHTKFKIRNSGSFTNSHSSLLWYQSSSQCSSEVGNKKFWRVGSTLYMWFLIPGGAPDRASWPQTATCYSEDPRLMAFE